MPQNLPSILKYILKRKAPLIVTLWSFSIKIIALRIEGNVQGGFSIGQAPSFSLSNQLHAVIFWVLLLFRGTL